MLAYKLVPTQKITHAKTWVYCNSKLKWKCYILGKNILVTIILDLIIKYLINIAYSLNSSIELIGNTYSIGNTINLVFGWKFC